MKQLVIIGCGPGSEAFLTPAALEAAEGVDVLLGDRRLLSLVPDSGAERLPLGPDIETALQILSSRLEQGDRAAVLVSGDPGLFSLSNRLIQSLGRDRCEIIPGVSSVQLAFARLGLSWEDARFLSAHGRIPSLSVEEMKTISKMAILLGGEDSLQWAEQVIRELSQDYRAYLCENLSLPDERVVEIGGRSLRKLSPSSRSILVLTRGAWNL